MTRRVVPRPATVLVYSEDEQVLASVRLLLEQVHPEAELHCVQRVEDAVSHGTGMAIDLALLDQSHSQRLSPLIRLLRGHSPRLKVVVFGDAADDTQRRITRWEEVANIVSHTLHRFRAPARPPGP